MHGRDKHEPGRGDHDSIKGVNGMLVDITRPYYLACLIGDLGSTREAVLSDLLLGWALHSDEIISSQF